MKPATMKPAAIALIVLASAAAFLAAAPEAALSQEGRLREDYYGNRYDRRLAGLKAFNLKESRTKPGCPDYYFESEVNYPAATGNPRLDRMFESAAATDVKSPFDELVDAECEDFEMRQAGEYTRHFEAHSPSPGVLSIVFTLGYSPLGAAGGSYAAETLVVDVARAAPMELKDVFPDYDRAAPALWAAVARGWCASPSNDQGVLPPYYELPEGSDSCRGTVPRLPPSIARDPSVFKGFGHVFLTAEGLTIRLTSWEAWGPHAAEEDLEIGKAQLIRMGARPEIWR